MLVCDLERMPLSELMEWQEFFEMDREDNPEMYAKGKQPPAAGKRK